MAEGNFVANGDGSWSMLTQATGSIEQLRSVDLTNTNPIPAGGSLDFYVKASAGKIADVVYSSIYSPAIPGATTNEQRFSVGYKDGFAYNRIVDYRGQSNQDIGLINGWKWASSSTIVPADDNIRMALFCGLVIGDATDTDISITYINYSTVAVPANHIKIAFKLLERKARV